MNDKSQVEYMLDDIRAMMDNVIIKLTYLVDRYETTSMRREADKFIAASLERDTFYSYKEYPVDVLVNAGITNVNEIMEYNADRNKIPREKRKEVLKYMRQTVINEYEERNDYYRELIGKPPINTPESEWFYLSEEEMAYYNIDEVRPIHDYPIEIQMKLERVVIPNLIKMYPERTYLKHMGSKSVNLVRARQARNFEIIFTDIQLDHVFMRSFFETYDFCREYFMSIIYNKQFKARYDLYDNFIGMHIMVMTVQRLIVDTIKLGIDRDFYDLVSIEKLFNVYGLPFYSDLPLDYQRMICKNLNWLLRCKSTDKVLYDVANTLFYERVNIHKYYLVKERKFDEETGEPIFAYKTEILDEINRVFLRSDSEYNYLLTVEDGVLKTVRIDNASAHAPYSIYMKDDITGQKYRLHMIGDRLSAEEIYDEDLGCQDIYLYDVNDNKYRLYFSNGGLYTSEAEAETRVVYDYEKMFDVYFQSTDIMERNVITTIESKSNRYDYDEVVDEDVYWWETEELLHELYEREYNFIDTKYIGINIMQNLTNLLYETCYFLNMLVDHKDTTVPIYFRILNSDAMKTGTDYLYLVLDRISSVPISIFDTVITLCALVSKKNGMKGNIIAQTPSKILSVMGFNFELNFDLIRENIQKYKRVFKNQEILKYLDLLDIQTVEDIDILYNNFKNFAEFCADVIANTTDINEYKAYKELYKVFTVREDTTTAFTMSNGKVATTYLEYLYDRVPHIAEFVNDLHKDKTGVYIEHIIGKLNELIPEIEYLSAMNGTNNNIITALVGLINFFKSYTVDMRNLNVMYMFNNKTLNKIYMIDDPRLFIKLFPEEKALTYNDNISYLANFDKHDNLIIYSKQNEMYNKIIPKHKFNTECKLDITTSGMQYNDTLELDYKDTIELINKFEKYDIIDLRTLKVMSNEIILKEKYNTNDLLMLYNLLNLLDKMELDYKDLIKEIIINNRYDINLILKTLKDYTINISTDFNIEVNDEYEYKNELFNEEKNFIGEYSDMIHAISDSNYKSSVTINDFIKVIHED